MKEGIFLSHIEGIDDAFSYDATNDSFVHLGDSILPSLHQDFQLSIELSDSLSLSHSADNYTAILWFYAVNELFAKWMAKMPFSSKFTCCGTICPLGDRYPMLW